MFIICVITVDGSLYSGHRINDVANRKSLCFQVWVKLSKGLFVTNVGYFPQPNQDMSLPEP